ncbi:MAG TPA: YqaJ viral recombinase family protein, partial [Flavobacteriales bacterium]|nr:YqaJ viral recombinase family protein [Flavobacteriales bacterium]
MEPKFKFHYTPIPQSREKWLQNRQVGIGGSEVGTVLGVNPYESSIKLFYRKLGIVPLEGEDNMAMFMGRFLEDKIAELWQYYNLFEEDMIENFNHDRKKKFCEKVNYTIKNNHYPHLLANLDRMILPEGKYENAGYGVLEVKTIASYNAKQWEDGIPPYHLAQLQTYLIITEFEYGEIAMLVDGRKLEVFEFERDEYFIEEIIHKTALFWDKVERGRAILANKFITETER